LNIFTLSAPLRIYNGVLNLGQSILHKRDRLQRGSFQQLIAKSNAKEEAHEGFEGRGNEKRIEESYPVVSK